MVDIGTGGALSYCDLSSYQATTIILELNYVLQSTQFSPAVVVIPAIKRNERGSV